MARRKICVVTGTRAEYGLLTPLLHALKEDSDFELQIIATAAHLSPEFGLTYKLIEQDGFAIDAKVEMLLSSDTPAGIAKSIGLGTIGFADAFEKLLPELVILLGDRFELLAAANAALVARIPIAHISGGEVTRGAIDDSIRHAITKMATYHFPGAEAYRERIIRMGEDPALVMNFGDIGLDTLRRLPLLSREELGKSIGLALGQPMFLVTYHPATLGGLEPEEALSQLFQALDQFPKAQVIFTKPNADTGGRVLARMIDEFGAARADHVHVFTSLGQLRYLSAMQHCDVVIGNSSSGIVEAPALRKPSVNIGDRQDGRLKATSVIDCAEEVSAIADAIRLALSAEFKALAAKTESLYGDSDTSVQIVSFLKQADFSLQKQFYDSDDSDLRRSHRIGGEFEISPKDLGQAVLSTAAPGLPMPHTLSLNTGRSAIYVALQDILRRGGRKIAYLPAYCCESVIRPFQQLEFEIKFYSAGKDLASPSGLPIDLENTTFLYIHYFGLRNEKTIQWVKQARMKAKFFVIEDCVQAGLTSEVGNDGDYAVTSLRKIVAQPDGALLGSKTRLPEIELEEPEEAFVSQKLIGKVMRSQDLPGETYLGLLEDSESSLDETIVPRRGSWASAYLMERTDFSHVAMARRRNWKYFSGLLEKHDLGLVCSLFRELKEGEVPLGHPLIVGKGLRDALRAFLKGKKIFCPVHWPLGVEQIESGCVEDVELSKNILTIPIDQRMDAAELNYVVDCIRQFALQL